MLFADPAGGDWRAFEQYLRLLGVVGYGALGLILLIAWRLIVQPTGVKSESPRGQQTSPQRRPTRE
jgi:hypothetical protein